MLTEGQIARTQKAGGSRVQVLASCLSCLVNPAPKPCMLPSQVLLVDRPGLKQATVALGEPGVGLKDPDSPALDVLTSVLNNFGGRLFNQIRSREVRSDARQGLQGFGPQSLRASAAYTMSVPAGCPVHQAWAAGCDTGIG